MMVSNFVLLIICLQITLRGAGSQEIVIEHGITTITPKCNETFKKLCLNTPDSKNASLKEIKLDFPMCRLRCFYEVSPDYWRGTSLNLPDNLPCEYGWVCKNGKCVQDVC
ncbi:uncharacterized protein LOC115310382 [Ixodes scapularis]|uniref:uncharacterized protein LOC115310382 n=1 Tax=Ixodes scapularis TaxID=6945 RepID=UPI001A9E36B2|nr:uncharacterized protein LOC115310382 [Ixodes scapularis]